MRGLEQLRARREKLLDLIAEHQKKGSLTDAEIKDKNHLIMQVWDLDESIAELEGER